MRIVRGGKKRAALAEKLDDDRIGSEDVLALVFGQAFGIDAAVVQRSGSFEAIFLAGQEVLDAVARGGMNDSAALLERDVIGKNAGDFDGQEGMLEFHALEFAAFDRGTNAGFPEAELAPQSIDTIGGNQQCAALRVHDGIVEIGAVLDDELYLVIRVEVVEIRPVHFFRFTTAGAFHVDNGGDRFGNARNREVSAGLDEHFVPVRQQPIHQRVHVRLNQRLAWRPPTYAAQCRAALVALEARAASSRCRGEMRTTL